MPAFEVVDSQDPSTLADGSKEKLRIVDVAPTRATILAPNDGPQRCRLKQRVALGLLEVQQVTLARRSSASSFESSDLTPTRRQRRTSARSWHRMRRPRCAQLPA